ncbi:MAG: flagellar hook-associated protein FlgK [Sphingobium sp.]
MSGVTDLLNIGASGVRAHRAAMGAVSENIANATTEGYNRRTVEMSESASATATSLLYKSGVSFGGVEVKSVTRKTDPYLDLSARHASGNFESADARATWLGNVQTALDDGKLGVGQQMTTMFSSVERLAANPTDTTLRTNMLFSVEQVNAAFKQTAGELANVQSGIVTSAESEVASLNDAIGRVASANEALRRAVPGSANAAQLLDERDQGLADIAKRVEITVSYRDSGVVDVSFQGAKIVDNIVPGSFAVGANANGTLVFGLNGTLVNAPKSGSLSGLAQSATVAADRVAQVDALAAQYVTDMNAWHQNGRTAAGTPGQPLLSGADASSIALLISDTKDIASRSADGRANGNLVAISTVRGANGAENGWTAIIAAQANMLSATKAEQSASSNRNQQAQNARADVSGIDLDREAADLMRLQQAYEGCARIIQVARESMQAIFAIF